MEYNETKYGECDNCGELYALAECCNLSNLCRDCAEESTETEWINDD